MVFHTFKIDVVLDLEFIILGLFLQIIINVGRLIFITKMFK